MDAANYSEMMNAIAEKAERMIAQIGGKCPHFAGKDGKYDDMVTDWWTTGFWPGMLWILYDMTGKEQFKEAAWHWDEVLERWFVQESDTMHHDVGFQFLPTAVIKHTLIGDRDGLRRGLEAANFLAARFNPVGNFIRAWNGNLYGWSIIDTMMNISLLFWASRETGDPRYKHIAVRHADTALQYSLREDGSVNHIITFDPETGAFIEPLGGQGRAADSAWSRGTAWALNGFANAYRNTRELRYLQAAKRVAHFFIASLPDDRVPYWDFRLESFEGEPRDSSAAAIAASGLLEIAEFVPAAEKHIYAEAAKSILKSLTEHYATWDQPNHEAILTGATASRPTNHCVDGSLIYGDYYYVEAFAKLNEWKQRIF